MCNINVGDITQQYADNNLSIGSTSGIEPEGVYTRACFFLPKNALHTVTSWFFLGCPAVPVAPKSYLNSVYKK